MHTGKRAHDANELLKLENEFWQSLRDNDAETATRLTDEKCLLAGPQGVSEIRSEQMADLMRSATYTLHEFKLDEPHVRFVTDDVAVVAYKIHEELTVDGKSVKLDAAEASTWVRRDGRWVCAMHAEAIEGDPFGRDRTAKAKEKRA